MPWRPRRPGWLLRQFGRRGVFLIMFGLIYLCFGATSFLIDSPRFDDIPLIGRFLDSRWWGIMWVVGGGVSVAIGVARGRGAHDGLGFTALLVPPVVWSAFYAISAITFLASGGTTGRILSLPSLLVWSVVWTVVLLIAGWPDTTRPEHAGSSSAKDE
jgi:drug/metabolite transporter (DMT)-like permease